MITRVQFILLSFFLLAETSQNKAMTPSLLKKVAKELSAKDGIVRASLPTFNQSDTTGRAIKKE